MDTILATALASSLKNRKETFSEVDPKSGADVVVTEYPSVWGGATANIIGLMIAVLAAYLSWTCNTKLKYELFYKILFAFIAFNFGGLYLVYYALFRFDTCRP